MATCSPALSEFASHVVEGLTPAGNKQLSPRYFYDDLGSALFEAITLLPEYGLTRADERLLERHAGDIARTTGRLARVVELGSGSGRKTMHVLREQVRRQPGLVYHPIDVSDGALQHCRASTAHICAVEPICNDWIKGLDDIARARRDEDPLLLLFLGSSIGNLSRSDLPDFARAIRANLRRGDYFLLGADLVKDVDRMIAAYDDATGVTSAFNLNILNRMNRDLLADFDLRSFIHEARWNELERRIEMHLVSMRDQIVTASAIGARFVFKAGETIWTESSHKFGLEELEALAAESGFESCGAWVDSEWPLAEVLWCAK